MPSGAGLANENAGYSDEGRRGAMIRYSCALDDRVQCAALEIAIVQGATTVARAHGLVGTGTETVSRFNTVFRSSGTGWPRA